MRAEKLLECMGAKESEWLSQVAESEEALSTLLGDIMLLAASVTYLGPHDQSK